MVILTCVVNKPRERRHSVFMADSSYNEKLQATNNVVWAFRKKALDNIVTSMNLKYAYLSKVTIIMKANTISRTISN